MFDISIDLIRSECRDAWRLYKRFNLQISITATFFVPTTEKKYVKSQFLDRKITINTEKVPERMIADPNEHFEKWVDSKKKRQTGFVLKRIEKVTLSIFYAPSNRGSGYVVLPLKTRSLLNIKNADDECSLNAIEAALNPIMHGRHSDRASNYNIRKYYVKGIVLLLDNTDIAKLEAHNRDNKFVINLYLDDGAEISCRRLARDFCGVTPVGFREIELLFYAPKDQEVNHYCRIKN